MGLNLLEKIIDQKPIYGNSLRTSVFAGPLMSISSPVEERACCEQEVG